MMFQLRLRGAMPVWAVLSNDDVLCRAVFLRFDFVELLWKPTGLTR